MNRGRRGRDETPAEESPGASYTNRMGVTYYVHEGRTKTGKARYFAAKSRREGLLATMPGGFEFAESVNGVVSVRRIDRSPPCIPAGDVALARAEVARHPHLEGYRIDVVKDEIVLFEPFGGVFPPLGGEMMPGFTDLLRSLGRRGAPDLRRVRYVPVMKFTPLDEGRGYSVRRMTYRSDAGWSWPLASCSLRTLLRRFVGVVGTDEFFELT